MSVTSEDFKNSKEGSMESMLGLADLASVHSRDHKSSILTHTQKGSNLFKHASRANTEKDLNAHYARKQRYREKKESQNVSHSLKDARAPKLVS